MTDSRYAPPHSGRRSPTLNPARLSMPVVPTIPSAAPGYSPYVGAVPILPPGHYDPPSRRQTNPPPPAATYPVTHDPMNRGSAVRQMSNGPASRAHRSSTIDSSNSRPVIITTTAPNRPHAGSSHSSGRSSDRSPIREPLRPGDDQYFSQPASSIRSRASHRPTYSTSLDNEDLLRLRDRTGDPRHLGLGEPYRPGRGPPSGPVYSNIPPRQRSIPTVENGYEYTDPADLVRYDLEHTRPAPGNSRRRRESLDRGGYYRPSVFVNAGYDRTRPPPASRGLERYNWNAAAGIYDNPGVRMPVPPPVPLAPPPSDSSRRPDPTMSPVTRRERPVSMYLDDRSSHDPSYYLPREEERHPKERREPDREYDRSYEPNYFHDDSVGTRGFGIRTDDNYDNTGANTYRRPGREYVEKPPEPQRHSDEDPLDRRDDRDRRARADRERRRTEDDRDRERRPVEGDRDPGRTSLRDRVATSLGATAAAIGAVLAKEKDADKGEPREESRRRRSPDEDRRDERRPEAEPRERSHSRYREREPKKKTAQIVIEEDKDNADHKDGQRNHHDAEATRLNGDSASSSGQLTPTSEEEREATAARPNKRGKVTSFKPTDTDDLMEVKAKLAELNVSEKDKDKDKDSDSGSVKRSPSPEKRAATPALAKEESSDESRGRELVKAPEKTEKQVRVVSPPREKSEAKPLKGILKAPSQKFPEEPNPIREGVAPHKDDKTKKDAPPGARWTKIRRDIVNPEALTAGKERFEVRDNFVIVLRVLNKEEIEQYAYATQLIREKRHDERLLREKQERESEHEHAKDRDKDEDERRRHHRQHRREEEVDERKYRERDYDRDREREKHRRHRHENEEDYPLMLENAPKQIEYPGHNHGVYHRSHRDRERETAQV